MKKQITRLQRTICGKLLIRSWRKTWAVAALLAGLYLYPLTAHAQTAVWRGGAPTASPTASPNPFDWNTPQNWSTNPIVPNAPTAQANFDQNPNGNRGPITLSAPTSVSTLTFNAPDYRFAISTVTLNIFSGISNNGNPPTFNVTGTGNLQFFNNASAGNAIINMTGGTGASPTQFFGTSTAANATITLSNGSDLNFRDSSRAGNATITTNNGSDVFFFGNSTGGEARFITNFGGCLDISGLLSDGMTVGSIEGAGRYNLGSKQLTVGLNNRSTEVSGEIDDGGVGGGTGGSLTKVGTGTLILSGTNTYTGGTTISQGTLQLGNGGTTGSVKGDVLDNGVLAISRSGVVTQSEVIIPLSTNPATGIITGSGSLEQLGPGTLVLTGNNGYTGTTTVSGGTLGIGMGGSIAASSGVDLTASGTRFDISGAGGNQTIRDLSGVAASEVTLGANTLTAGTANSTTFAGVISGTGEFAKQGIGTLTLSGNNIYTGGTTIKAGTLQLGNGGTTGSILGNVTDNGTLVFNRSDTVTFPGVISGTGGVRQIGPGTLTLTGVDTYSGGTNFEGGILAVQGTGHLGTGPEI